MPPAKKAGADAGIHFVTGSDEAEVKNAASELAARLAPADDPFAIETIDGAVATVDEARDRIHSAIAALLTLPFLGGAKLVWLKSASFLSDTVTGRSETVTAAIDKLLAVLERGLPAGVTFLLSAIEPDKRRTAYRTLGKLAIVHLHDKPDFGWGSTEADVVNWVADRAAKAGLRLTDDAAAVLAARVGAESRQLDSEIEKLSLAFGTDTALIADQIRDLVPATRAGGIFDLSNALAKRDLGLCLRTLDQLFRQGEKGVGILLAAIMPTVRNLLVAKDLLLAHRLTPPAQPQFFSSALNRLPPAAIAHLPRKKDGTLNAYPLGIAAANSARYTLPELQAAFLACARANKELVTTQLAEQIVLSRLVVEIAGK
ncbi:MAG: DNA polymerase III subunit delta [Terrimicrobiaceae bacterium]|nr:DNA polymerase III subunit delta [Terrimicrobiaceae bacterium]